MANKPPRKPTLKPARKPDGTGDTPSPRAARADREKAYSAWGVIEERPAKKTSSRGAVKPKAGPKTEGKAPDRNRGGKPAGPGRPASAGRPTSPGRAATGERPAYGSRPTSGTRSSGNRFGADEPVRMKWPPRVPGRGKGPSKTTNPHPDRADAKPGEGPQRIAKLLARAGIASRREIERMIVEGRVAINGVAIDTPATLLTNLHGVTVDGNPVAKAEAVRLFLFHKPSGYLTAERDPVGRPTIYDKLPADLPRLMPIGRLDMSTEGLLLMTNDGGLKRTMELPANGVERTYRARAFGEVSQAQLEDLIEGVEIEGVRYSRIDANLERRTGRNQWIEMTLTEGKNREVRRVLEHLGLEVNRLIRTRYGPFLLADLPPGAVVEVKQHEMEQLMKELRA